jgi:hypothetical protein
MPTETRPTFRAWWSWRDGKAAVQVISFVAIILVGLLNELVPVRMMVPKAGFAVRMVIRVAEYLVLVAVLMYATWLFRRGRITRDPREGVTQ